MTRAQAATIVAVSALVSGSVLGIATAAPATEAPLPFTDVARSSTQPRVRSEHVGSSSVEIITTALAIWPYSVLTQRAAQKMKAVDLGAKFLVLVSQLEPSSGYTLAIRRLAVQPVTRKHRQLCIIVKIGRPSGPRTGTPAYAADVVAASRARFRLGPYHWSIPPEAVVRSTTGALLTAHNAGSVDAWEERFAPRPGLCHR